MRAKKMLEIERKFLVKRLPWRLARFPHRRIEQGYLLARCDGFQVRLRKSGRIFQLTTKRNEGIARDEIEIALTRAQFAQLWPATRGWRLTKIRYLVPLGAVTAEIDIYLGRHKGLVVVEVEFANVSACRQFEPPDWFGAEVSGDPRYSNVRLAFENGPLAPR